MNDKRLGVNVNKYYGETNPDRGGLITRTSVVEDQFHMHNIPCCEMNTTPCDTIADSDGAAYRKRL